MERFVQAIGMGGVVMVAGLWLIALSPRASGRWLVGAAAAAVGVIALLFGIGKRIEVGS